MPAPGPAPTPLAPFGWHRTAHVEQGEVEQISMMKPKGQTEHETGLLEYLEDIIGTDKYIPRLEESAKK